jgi:phage/plasmid-associated DNA primase
MITENQDQLLEFLALLGHEEYVHLRLMAPKQAKPDDERFYYTNKNGKRQSRVYPIVWDLGSTAELEKYNREGFNIYFVVGVGGTKKEDITGVKAIFYESDHKSIEEQLAIDDALDLLPTLQVYTGGKSIHSYRVAKEFIEPAKFTELQKKLQIYANSDDSSLSDAGQVMRLPFFDRVDLDSAGQLVFKPVELINSDPDQLYDLEEFEEEFADILLPPIAASSGINSYDHEFAKYYHLLEDYNDSGRSEWATAKCPAHEGDSTDSLHIRTDNGAFTCHAGCKPYDIIKAMRRLVDNTNSDGGFDSLITDNLITDLTYVNAKGVVKLHQITIITQSFTNHWQDKIYYDLNTKEFMLYENGVWSVLCDEKIRREIDKTINATGIGTGDITRSIVTKLTASLCLEPKLPPKNLLPFQNGVLDVNTMVLLPHNKEYYFTWQLPFPHNPLATCDPIWEWLLSTQDGDVNRTMLLIAYLRATVVGATDVHKFLEIYSTTGGTGKSTFCNLARALVGDENVAITSNKALENRFETARFKDKRLLYFPDGERYISQCAVDIIKRISGGDMLPYEVKFKSVTQFIPTGMIIIATNTRLMTDDTAIGRRRISVPFLNVIEPESRRNLDEEFKPYLAGLMNMVLAMSDKEMRQYLVLTEKHVPSLTPFTKDTLITSDSIAYWADTCLVQAPDTKTSIGNAIKVSNGNSYSYKDSKLRLYPSYCEFCLHNGYKAVAQNRFKEKVINLLIDQLKIPNVEWVRTKKGRFFTGIVVRNSNHDDIPNLINDEIADGGGGDRNSLIDRFNKLLEEEEGGGGE